MPKSSRPRFYEFAKLWEIHDGDTVRLLVDLGFQLPMARVWIQLRGVRCPELSEGEPGQRARNATTEWFAQHAPDGWVSLSTYRSSKPTLVEIKEEMTFIRFVGQIGTPASSLNLHLQDLGYVDQG